MDQTNLLVGRVLKSFCGYFHIKSEVEDIYLAKARGKLDTKNILVGDLVEFMEISEKEALIERVFRRNNQFEHPHVANIDQIFIFFSIKMPDFSSYLLDRFLILTQTLGVPIKIVISKLDLTHEIKAELKAYEKIGFEVFYISNKSKSGIEELKKQFLNKISLITGPSGVGKSTTLNSIHPGLNLKIGDVSNIKRGMHTTRYAEMVEIIENSFVIDTPGFTNISVKILPGELIDYFGEFADFRRKCKFSNCIHVKEIGCGIKQAVENGNIALSRYDNYLKIYDEIKNNKKWSLYHD